MTDRRAGLDRQLSRFLGLYEDLTSLSSPLLPMNRWLSSRVEVKSFDLAPLKRGNSSAGGIFLSVAAMLCANAIAVC